MIGPNGSGKTTLLEILCGRIKPDSGEVAIRKRAKRLPAISLAHRLSDTGQRITATR
ncbi:MAG TPA: ATP-binding cassette domain-containing protein [Terriglobia bacterium]|nr:ATP-binding cassette domain-containing protein [Terriglobia bacterium]